MIDWPTCNFLEQAYQFCFCIPRRIGQFLNHFQNFTEGGGGQFSPLPKKPLQSLQSSPSILAATPSSKRLIRQAPQTTAPCYRHPDKLVRGKNKTFPQIILYLLTSLYCLAWTISIWKSVCFNSLLDRWDPEWRPPSRRLLKTRSTLPTTPYELLTHLLSRCARVLYYVKYRSVQEGRSSGQVQ